MLGGFALGAAALGGLPTIELIVYIPVQDKKPEGTIIIYEGSTDIKNFDDGVDFIY